MWHAAQISKRFTDSNMYLKISIHYLYLSVYPYDTQICVLKCQGISIVFHQSNLLASANDCESRIENFKVRQCLFIMSVKIYNAIFFGNKEYNLCSLETEKTFII